MNELIDAYVDDFTPKDIQYDFMLWSYPDIEEATLSNSTLINISSTIDIYFCLI